VTNVTNFGAFVDIGVHQDGLVHVSALSNSFVKDPRAVVKPGDVVRVKVVEVDLKRRRIALTMRMGEERRVPPARKPEARPEARRPEQAAAKRPAQAKPSTGGALAEAFARAALKPPGR
jgi:uncharacterized protein